MNKVEADVRAERDEIALETVKLDQQAAWRKLCDQWQREPREKHEPQKAPEHESKLDVDYHKYTWDYDNLDPLVVGPTNLPRLSLTEAAVRLAILHDHVFNDGLYEPILTKEWYESLGPLWEVGVICWRDRMRKLDRYELTILQRCLIQLQTALGTGAPVKQAPPLAEREQQVLDIITDQPKGTGITGQEIINLMQKKNQITLEQGSLTGHIIPKLKKWYGVDNRPRAGYYREQS